MIQFPTFYFELQAQIQLEKAIVVLPSTAAQVGSCWYSMFGRDSSANGCFDMLLMTMFLV